MEHNFLFSVVKKLKAVHIHTDVKFIEETTLFEGEKFSNEVIVIGKSTVFKSSFDGKNYNRNYFSIKKIIDRCNRSDIVVLYDLDRIKSSIVNSLSRKVYVVWRFFGYELYKRNKYKYLSEMSQSVRQGENEAGGSFSGQIRKAVSAARPLNFMLDLSFENAVSRVDCLLCLSRSEYDELLETWPDLPQCLVIPTWYQWETESAEDLWAAKEPVIILGNNRSIYNNHLDIIKRLKSSEIADQYSIVLPFSYGPNGEYATRVAAETELLDRFLLLKTFLPFDVYVDFIRRSYALVINSYRQMAMDNIFIGIRKGVKLYLNPKNVIFNWLESKGVLVSDVNDLITDIDNRDIRLSKQDILRNMEALRRYEQEYSTETFRDLLYEKSVNKINDDTDY